MALHIRINVSLLFILNMINDPPQTPYELPFIAEFLTYKSENL